MKLIAVLTLLAVPLLLQDPASKLVEKPTPKKLRLVLPDDGQWYSDSPGTSPWKLSRIAPAFKTDVLITYEVETTKIEDDGQMVDGLQIRVEVKPVPGRFWCADLVFVTYYDKDFPGQVRYSRSGSSGKLNRRWGEDERWYSIEGIYDDSPPRVTISKGMRGPQESVALLPKFIEVDSPW